MTQRWLAAGGLVEDRAYGPLMPSPLAAWQAPVQKGARAVLGGDRRGVCWGIKLRRLGGDVSRFGWRRSGTGCGVPRSAPELRAGAVSARTPIADGEWAEARSVVGTRSEVVNQIAVKRTLPGVSR